MCCRSGFFPLRARGGLERSGYRGVRAGKESHDSPDQTPDRPGEQGSAGNAGGKDHRVAQKIIHTDGAEDPESEVTMDQKQLSADGADKAQCPVSECDAH